MEKDIYLYLEGKVADVMSRNPVTVNKRESLEHLIDMFKAHNFHGYPVTDDDGHLVGIVRDTDILSIFARRDPGSVSLRVVEDVMQRPPLVIDQGETVQKAIMKMFKDQTRFLAATGEGGRVEGVVTRTDLIRGIHVRRLD
ncbi:MAG: CBS domain-containing protein [Actinomycetota bacterium]